MKLLALSKSLGKFFTCSFKHKYELMCLSMYASYMIQELKAMTFQIMQEKRVTILNDPMKSGGHEHLTFCQMMAEMQRRE